MIIVALTKLFRSIIQNPRSILYRTFVMLILSATCLSLSAAQLYRYKDEQGLFVLSQTLPAEYASQGYDILNEKGRVIQTVAPALTAEEIMARDAELERERQAQIAKQKQDKIDEELKQLYSEPNDAVRVLSRRVQDIKGLIDVKNNKIKNLKLKIADQEAQAADRQRRGFPVSEDAFSKLQTLQREIDHNLADIVELHKDIEKLVSLFDEKIKRLEVITKKSASNYPAFLESLKDGH